ncbi:Lrp/AsnC ligand binding domain-containing protein, partial [Tenacibaculum halocynthiae]
MLEVSYIAGSFDILLKLILKDMNEYQIFVLKEMSQLEII